MFFEFHINQLVECITIMFNISFEFMTQLLCFNFMSKISCLHVYEGTCFTFLCFSDIIHSIFEFMLFLFFHF